MKNCPDEVTLSWLPDVGRLIEKMGGIIPWGLVLDYLKRRKWAEY